MLVRNAGLPLEDDDLGLLLPDSQKKICCDQIWQYQQAKNSGDKKSLVVLFFKQDTWEEEQSKSILATKKNQRPTGKRILKNKQDLYSSSELHVTVCYQEEDNSS